MGQDKALLPFKGKPLIQHVIERLAGLADEILIITDQRRRYVFQNAAVIPDILPGCGPLGGLHTALKTSHAEVILAAACDMPFANPAIFAHALRILEKENLDAVVPSSGSGLEPLHAVYRCATCLPLVEQALAAGERKLITWFPSARVRILEPTELQSFDPQGLAFWNLNTPEDLKQAEEFHGQA